MWHHRDGVPAAAATLAAALDGAPPRFATAPESVLAGQLEAARRIIDALPAAAAGAVRSTIRRVSEEFERIRWFPLPGEGLAPLRASQA